jgi:hypothetical protein
MILASYRVVGLEPLAHRVFEALLSQHLQRIVMCIKLPYRNTLSLLKVYRRPTHGVFLYGRGTENRTLIYWLKASYFSR